MLFWSKADNAALPRAHNGGEGQDGLARIDTRSIDRDEAAERATSGAMLELVEGHAGGWAQTLVASGRRFFDLTFAVLALTATFPLMIVIILTIRMSSEGPALYRQRRIGRRGRPFDCLKFRTMVPDADSVLADLLDADPELRQEFREKHKLTNDPRITRIGQFLRRTSLDELPQFINVLKGDMSVVGPRPIVAEETERYGQFLPIVLSVRPGITGLWQVSGRNDTTYEERVWLDQTYVLNRSVLLDLRIILKTVRVMVAPSNGAY